MDRRIVVAVGGNAILRENQPGDIGEQLRNLEHCTACLARLAQGGARLLVVHGNGPQVGNILLRDHAPTAVNPPMPLDVYIAKSQGQLGYMLQRSLANRCRDMGLDRDVVTLLTMVEVAPDDPGFDTPSKPIGPFYSLEEVTRLTGGTPFPFMEDAGRGYRRVVPSPRPRRVVELKAIESLLDRGGIVIAAGGGGIPVVCAAGRDGGGYRGVEAVIDKDYSAALLARDLRADRLLILTGVEQVAVRFNTPDQRMLGRVTLAEMEAYAAQGEFPGGSMGPKIDAAMGFVRDTGNPVVITSMERAADALAGRGGTHLVAG